MPQRWIALCASADCGEITSNPDPVGNQFGPESEEPLKDFMLGHSRSHPYTKPWIKLFLRAASYPSAQGWRPSGNPCWTCQEPDLVFCHCFYPLHAPYDVTLCLRCGSVSATTFSGMPHRRARVTGGLDWAVSDAAIDLFRSALRQLDGVWDLD